MGDFIFIVLSFIPILLAVLLFVFLSIIFKKYNQKMDEKFKLEQENTLIHQKNLKKSINV